MRAHQLELLALLGQFLQAHVALQLYLAGIFVEAGLVRLEAHAVRAGRGRQLVGRRGSGGGEQEGGQEVFHLE